jgi:hypothetical protein
VTINRGLETFIAPDGVPSPFMIITASIR